LEIDLSQIAKIHLNSLPWLEKISMAKNALKIVHPGWKTFEIHLSKMAQNEFKSSMIFVQNFEVHFLKWLKIHLNCPP